MYRVAKGRRVRLGSVFYESLKPLPKGKDYAALVNIGDVEEIPDPEPKAEDIAPVRITKERVSAFNRGREEEAKATKKQQARIAKKKSSIKAKQRIQAEKDARDVMIAELLPDQPGYKPPKAK